MTRRRGDVRSRGVLFSLLSLSLLVAGLAATSSQSARAEILGAVPTGTPNANFGCERKPTVVDAFGNIGLVFSGAASCTMFQNPPFGRAGSLTSGFAPRNGAITGVTVRSGPNPAPIRVTVLRSLAGLRANGTLIPGSSQCCFGRSRTRAFGLRPNGTTRIPLNLVVRNFKDLGNRQAVSDIVGISATSGTGALPLRTTRPNPNNADLTIPGNPSVGFLYPEILPGQVRVDLSGVPSHRLTVNFNFCSGTPNGRTAVQGRDQRTPCRVRTMAGTLRVSNGKVGVPVACTGLFGPCRGRITITTPRRPFRVLATRAYFLKAGKQATFRTGLTRLGKSRLRGRNQLPARAKVTASKNRTSVRRVTLRK